MSSANRRVLRMEREVQECLSRLLIRDYQNALPGFLSLGRVKMSGDLRTAKIYVSAFGENASNSAWVEYLTKRAYQIQTDVAHELRLRFCPKMSFFEDDATLKVIALEKTISAVTKNESKNSLKKSFAGELSH